MKKERIDKVIEEYYRTTMVSVSGNIETYLKKCYDLGYLDGYIGEEIYKELIKREDGMISYNRGYSRGRGKRDNSFSREVNPRKIDFFSKLAIFDAINSIERYNISPKGRKIYDQYTTVNIDFKSGKITPMKK